MTERDLFVQCIPQIAEMVIECRKLTEEQYQAWKAEWLELAEKEGTAAFVRKVLIVIDKYLQKADM